ncbi:Fe2+ transport system protein A [Magnetospira sp. QH-2]|nr:Fe2+ transport system protein A [Magnetospira sp. QH-2]
MIDDCNDCCGDTKNDKTLADLKAGEQSTIICISGDDSLKRRLSSMGVVKGTQISLDRKAPLGDPRAYELMGYKLSLRQAEAKQIVIEG